MLCNKCKHTLPDDSEFCQYCGNELEVVDKADISDMPDLENMSSDDALKEISEFYIEETIKAMNANEKSQSNKERDSDFGLVPEKPIYTLALKLVDGETEYLNKLYTPKGEKIRWTVVDLRVLRAYTA